MYVEYGIHHSTQEKPLSRLPSQVIKLGYRYERDFGVSPDICLSGGDLLSGLPYNDESIACHLVGINSSLRFARLPSIHSFSASITACFTTSLSSSCTSYIKPCPLGQYTRL